MFRIEYPLEQRYVSSDCSSLGIFIPKQHFEFLKAYCWGCADGFSQYSTNFNEGYLGGPGELDKKKPQK